MSCSHQAVGKHRKNKSQAMQKKHVHKKHEILYFIFQPVKLNKEQKTSCWHMPIGVSGACSYGFIYILPSLGERPIANKFPSNRFRIIVI